MSFFLGGRALSFALFKWGCSCSVGLALTVGFALQVLLTGEGFTNMMAPSGASGASSSGNWREYLNLSSDNEGDSAPKQATPSVSWSGSWIEKWLNQEVAPNEGGHEATSRVMEQARPSQPAPWMAASSSEPSDLMVAVNQFYPNGNPTIGEGDVPPIPTPEEERAILKDRQIKEGIEDALANCFRAYCNRPSTAKRFPQINYPNLDFGASSRQLAQEDLDVGSKSREELLELFGLINQKGTVQRRIQ